MKKLALTLSAVFFPATALAAGLKDFIDASFDIVTNTLIPLAFLLCVLYFFWGVTKYIKSGAGGDKAAEEAKGVMVWGIVGIFVAFSVWGIVSFIKSELGIPDIQNVVRPK